jgi:hypothetical protein
MVPCRHVGCGQACNTCAALQANAQAAGFFKLQGTTDWHRTWHVTHSVWHSCVLPLLNSPYSSVMEPVSMPPEGGAHKGKQQGQQGDGCKCTACAQPCAHAAGSMLALCLRGGAAAPAALEC